MKNIMFQRVQLAVMSALPLATALAVALDTSVTVKPALVNTQIRKRIYSSLSRSARPPYRQTMVQCRQTI